MEDHIFFDGLRWWEPDEDAAVDIIRSIVGRTAELKTSPQARIIRDYTWAKAAARLIELVL
jgi:hypothetical protein